jgi:predicted GH43/DUF377 family glycosyl hydrolase
MKRIYTLMLLCIFSTAIFGQVNWTKYEGPVLENGPEGSWDFETAGFPSVIMIDDTYHMWYAGMESGILAIGHATSVDGFVWTKDPANPLLTKGEAGSWDDKGVYVPKVLYDGDQFHMWYNGSRSSGFEQIGHATSADGTVWTRDEANPVMGSGTGGEWDDGNVGPGGVIYDGESYHMWYAASSKSSTGNFKTGYATSENGTLWTRDENNPVMEHLTGTWESPSVAASDVLFDGDIYHLWYNGGDFAQWRVGYATSSDGLAWTRHEENPLLDVGSGGSWDDQFVSFASVLYDNGTFKMWYFGGSNGIAGKIGYAEAPTVSVRNKKIREDGALSIYPNPATNLITLKSEIHGIKTIEITSLNGQLMYSGVLEGNERQIDISGLSKGLYLLTLKSNSLLKTQKLIKLSNH